MKQSLLNFRTQRGVSLIEVLVALLILLLGLLGLAGLIRQSQVSEVESYQRVQALVLLKDIASRINANRAAAASYVTGTTTPVVGDSASTYCASPVGRAATDLCEWEKAIKGSSETANAGASKVGAMVGGRGCITSVTPTAAVAPALPAQAAYLVAVTWQGLTGTSAPPTSVLCGKDAYGDDRNRRAITAVVEIGNAN